MARLHNLANTQAVPEVSCLISLLDCSCARAATARSWCAAAAIEASSTGRACSRASRNERRREAATRCQQSENGRLRHVARSAAWRERRRPCGYLDSLGQSADVTHQGCSEAAHAPPAGPSGTTGGDQPHHRRPTPPRSALSHGLCRRVAAVLVRCGRMYAKTSCGLAVIVGRTPTGILPDLANWSTTKLRKFRCSENIGGAMLPPRAPGGPQ